MGPPSHYVAPPLVKGDAEIVISALKDGIISYPEFGHIIQDSLVLANEFRLCDFSHVRRLGNIVAHYLVRKAKSSNELQVWIESIPDDLAPLCVQKLFVILIFLFQCSWPLGLDSHPKKILLSQ